jgi:hypothetical protein
MLEKLKNMTINAQEALARRISVGRFAHEQTPVTFFWAWSQRAIDKLAPSTS